MDIKKKIYEGLVVRRLHQISELKKKVCLRRHDRSENFYDVRIRSKA
jgi:hypothetical protein